MRYVPRLDPSIIPVVAVTVIVGVSTLAPRYFVETVTAYDEKPHCRYIDTIQYDVGDFALYDCQTQQGRHEELRRISTLEELEERVKK